MNTKLTIALVLGAVFMTASDIQAQTTKLPWGELQIAYRHLEDGKLSDHVFETTLWCDTGGECSLTTLTLGQCVSAMGKRLWVPKVERWTTTDGSLSITRLGPDQILASFKAADIFSGQAAAYQLRFTFKAFQSDIGRLFGQLTDVERTPVRRR